jgi:hypothetical protein
MKRKPAPESAINQKRKQRPVAGNMPQLSGSMVRLFRNHILNPGLMLRIANAEESVLKTVESRLYRARIHDQAKIEEGRQLKQRHLAPM